MQALQRYQFRCYARSQRRSSRHEHFSFPTHLVIHWENQMIANCKHVLCVPRSPCSHAMMPLYLRYLYREDDQSSMLLPLACYEFLSNIAGDGESRAAGAKASVIA